MVKFSPILFRVKTNLIGKMKVIRNNMSTAVIIADNITVIQIRNKRG